tara:strand:+ start:312 stop:584 length:273 start_codon:yes stop_codon:yes gene_type:complete
MAKEVLVGIRHNGTLESFTANVSHEFALKYNLQVGSRFTLRQDDGTDPNTTISRGMKVGKIVALHGNVDMESRDVKQQPGDHVETYIVEV